MGATALDGEAWGVWDAAELVAEIDQELAEREALDGELVRKGRLDESEADYRRKVIADIRADLLEAFAPLAAGETFDWRGPRPDRAVAWANKVRWIDRELDERKRTYPELIRKGRLTKQDAQRRSSALELLRTLYWNKLFMWEPPKGPALEYLKAIRSAALSGAPAKVRDSLLQSEGAKILRELVRRHMETVDLEENGQQRLIA